MSVQLSLVLATLGRTDEVERFVDSLIAQTNRQFELLVVDQNNDERLTPLVRKVSDAGLNVTHLRLSPPSLSGARNLGVANAVGPVVAFPDDDCWYEPDTVSEAVKCFAQDEGLAGLVAQWVEQARARSGAPAGHTLALKEWRQFRGGDASSISLFVKRSLLEQLGGFDDRLGVGRWYGAGEETDLLLRALDSKAAMKHCPNVRVHHAFGSSAIQPFWSATGAQRRRARGTGALYVKHRLGAYVIGRGLIAPWFVPLAKFNLRQAAFGVFVALGRLEGWIRWAFKERR